MQKRHLLIIDGESFRSPGLVRAFEAAGWDLTWSSMLQVQLDFVPERETDALVVGEPVLVQGRLALDELAFRYPEAPLFATAPPPDALQASIRAVLTSPAEGWPSLIEPHLKPRSGQAPAAPSPVAPAAAPAAAPSGARPFTADDLFGDIIEDLGGQRIEPAAPAPVASAPAAPAAAPLPVAPVPPLPVVPAPAAPAIPVVSLPPAPTKPVVPAPTVSPIALRPPMVPPPVVKAPLPLPGESELEALLGLESRPVLAPIPVPASVEPEDGDISFLDMGTEAPVDPARKEECTLSGISGIHDPFQADAEVEVIEPAWEDATAAKPAPVEPEKPAPSLLDSMQMPILEEFGNYYLMDKIAVGGMAELFRARQRGVHDFQKIVAIKRILPHLSDNDEFVRMFIDEAKLAAQLTHPNIAQIFDLGKAGPFYYIAMEYVDGRDLRSMLRRVRDYRLPVPEAIAAFVTMKVAGALEYAHKKRGMDDKDLKLVHRDISPQNILISNDGAVKLVDFGIAKAATKSTQTVAGALKGKLLYMSPEQAMGEPLDHRSDIYSLGLVLFELLTGERCFQADSELGVLEKVRLGKVSDVKAINPSVSDAMASILRRATEKDASHRYASARQMEMALKQLLTSHRNEPSEHDVAEYAHTLLKGKREDLEDLIVRRFPPFKTELPVREVPATTAQTVPPPPPLPLPEPEVMGTQEGYRRVVPLVIVTLVLAALAIWIALRGTGL